MESADNQRPRKGSRENFRESLVHVLREYAEALIIAVVLALVLRFFVVSVYRVPTGSMFPNLRIGDFIVSYKLPYSFSFLLKSGSLRVPERGEIIVFRCPHLRGVSCVKRVVGRPGDRVQIIKKRVVVNGRTAAYARGNQAPLLDLPGHQFYAVVTESWGASGHEILIGQGDENQNFGPVMVPPDHVFVLGDNRDSSDDSRFWGAIPIKAIEGRAFAVWLSLDWRRPLAGGRLPSVRWERLMTGLD